MSEFSDCMADAFAEMMDTAGEDIHVGDHTISAVVDESETTFGNVPGGRATGTELRAHVKKEDFDSIGGSKGDKVFIPSRKEKGRITFISNFNAGHYTLTIGNPNQRK